MKDEALIYRPDMDMDVMDMDVDKKSVLSILVGLTLIASGLYFVLRSLMTIIQKYNQLKILFHFGTGSSIFNFGIKCLLG